MGQAFDPQGVIADLLAAPDVEARWRGVTAGLAAIGMDQINYGLLDPAAASRYDAPVHFLSTMDPGWIAYYGDRRLDMADPHVVFVRRGNLAPYRWGESALDRIDDPATRSAVAQTVEAGLRSQLSVTMADAFGAFLPMAGMTLGSSLPEAEYFKAIAGREAELVTIAHLFHQRSIGELRRRGENVPSLSHRERDCLRFVAQGLRVDAIAHKLGLARVTVELHLRRARRKLRAATLPEAVARALLFGEIPLG